MDDLPDFMTGGLTAFASVPAIPPIRQPDQPCEIAETSTEAHETPPFTVGVFDDMPAATYHATEAMSSSGAKKMLQSPAHYRLMRTTHNQPTPAMEFGTACHAGVLEPDTFNDVVVMAPKFNKRSTAGKEDAEAFAQEHAGKVILSPDDFARCRRVVDAVLAHPSAAKLLQGATVERSIFWQDARYKVPCKMRTDAMNFGGLVDLKTTQDASPEAFARTIAAFSYDLQAAFYLSGCEHLLNETPQFFVFIAVESEPPHAVACYRLGSASINAGGRRMDTALERYARALEAGVWPGYPEAITDLETPAWARRV